MFSSSAWDPGRGETARGVHLGGCCRSPGRREQCHVLGWTRHGWRDVRRKDEDLRRKQYFKPNDKQSWQSKGPSDVTLSRVKDQGYIRACWVQGVLTAAPSLRYVPLLAARPRGLLHIKHGRFDRLHSAPPNRAWRKHINPRNMTVSFLESPGSYE